MLVSRMWRGLSLAAIAPLAAVAVIGCGDDNGDGDGGGGSAASGANGGSAVLAEAKAAVEKASTPEGTYVLPEPGPEAQKGKKVFVIACGLSAEACSQPADAVKEAGKTLGWDVTTVDGKFTPAGYNAGVRQAIAANADGIIVVAIDCPNAKGAYQAANKANIPIVGTYAYDCDTPLVGDTPLFEASINSNGDPREWALANARLRADYAIAQSDAKAKVISLDQPEFLVARYWTQGFSERLKQCETCELVDSVDFTASDLGSGSAPQKLQTVLLRHPEADTLFVTSDALLQAVLPAIRRANKPNLRIIANEGFPATQELIRRGTVDVAVGIYSPWMGWSGADAMNRVFAGEKEIPNQGLGYHLMTEDNLRDGETWKPPLDYKTAFKNIWTGAS